jgi:diguanylate cyclase (GGDEF)-like protein
MLPRTTAEEAKHIAKRLSQKVKAIKMNPELSHGQEVHLSISQGIAVYPYDSQDQAELIHCADEALYYVKEGGRGFWVSYGDVKNDSKKDI